MRRYFFILGAFSIALIATFVALDSIAPAGRRLAKISGIDPVGYFGIAHSLLFDHDVDLSNEFERVPPDDNPYTKVQIATHHPGSVWPLGYSLVTIPFLATGVLVDRLAGNPADGYSRFAVLGYCLTNLVLTCIGLFAMFVFLSESGVLWRASTQQRSRYALASVGAFFLGTTVGYYAFTELSHACEFCCVSLLLLCWWRVRERLDARSWAALGLIGGFLSICRWQDSVYLLAPILFDVMNRGLRAGRLARLRNFAIYCAVAAVFWLPQGLEWRSIYGSFRLFPPLGSGFFVFPPRYILELLFSTRSGGWLSWTPLCLIGLAGLIYGAVKNYRVFLPWLIPLALEILLMGSTTTWHGGNSFGSRYMTSAAPLVGWGLATSLLASNRAGKMALSAATAAACLFTLLFAVQFRLDLIPKGERLTTAEYLTDKFRIDRAWRRKQAVTRAGSLREQAPSEDASHQFPRQLP